MDALGLMDADGLCDDDGLMDADAELDGLIDATCPKRVATPSSLLLTVPRYHSSGSGDGLAEADGLCDALGLMAINDI